MTFTEEEQKAILKVLDYLIKSDDFIHIQEVDYLEEIMDAYRIPGKYLMKVNELSLDASVATVEKMEPQKKNLFMGMVYGQADSDMVIRPQEQVFITYLKGLTSET